MISFFDVAENIVGKEENAGCQHFLLFPQCFQKLFQGCEKSALCGKELKDAQGDIDSEQAGSAQYFFM